MNIRLLQIKQKLIFNITFYIFNSILFDISILFCIFAVKIQIIPIMNIKDNVKKLCKLHGITQKELAVKIGVTDNSLSMTLGKNNPQLSTLKNIADALGVSVSKLLASPEEFELLAGNQQQDERGKVLRCPHCGEEIELYIKAL